MEQAAFYPISNPNGAWFHAPQVHNYIWSPAWLGADYTNIWLDPGKNGG